MHILIADSGATKTHWALLHNGTRKNIYTQGLSPYFVNTDQIITILTKELWPKVKLEVIDAIYFYGTGCSTSANNKIVAKALLAQYPKAKVAVDHDMMGAAKGLCHNTKGIACIIGTGSSACYYNGTTITKSRTGLGYALGDEGSGSYLGRMVLQHYLYQTFDADLLYAFEAEYEVTRNDILQAVYKQPFPQRYMATYTQFLYNHRGHYMIENILEDGINDFFFKHIIHFKESWKQPIHFVGGVANAFKDVIKMLAAEYNLTLGSIHRRPMDGLVAYYKSK